MNGQELIERLVRETGRERSEVDRFYKEFFQLIIEGLRRENYVRIKGLGTFKLIGIESRDSVNVHTGERFKIKEHNRIVFTPESRLKELINKPFSHFNTVLLNEGVAFEEAEKESDRSEIATLISEEFVETVNMTTTEKVDERDLKKSEKGKKNRTVLSKVVVGVLLICIVVGGVLYYRNGLERKKERVIEETKIVAPASMEKKGLETEKVVTIPVISSTMSSEDYLQQRNSVTPFEPDSVSYEIVGTETTYTIQEGETLTRVALRFYGTKALWPYIVMHNRDIIHNPDKVPCGVKLRIPKLEKRK